MRQNFRGREGSLSLALPALDISRRVHRDAHLALWQEQGSSDLILDGQRFHLPAGHACWIPLGVAHELHVSEGAILLPLWFMPTSMNADIPAGFMIVVDDDVRSAFLALIQNETTILRGNIDVEAQVSAFLRRKVGDASGDSGTVGMLPLPRSAQALQVATHLGLHPGETKRITELARMVHISERTLQRHFRNETGMTLQQWRTRNRMVRALHLMLSGQLVDIVAAHVGYRDVNAFRRAFKEHYGVPPSKWAQIANTLDSADASATFVPSGVWPS
ncbi:MAG: AraC family transcriptional regulator [Actinomycetaceae bacterium]|nr:AraC family transcriptional regulator [Actinomycetaceae bacterium]